MEHFYITKKFSSYEELSAVKRQYEKESKREFTIRDCRMLSNSRISRLDVANRALKYSHLRLCCVHGIRKSHYRSKGLRKRTARYPMLGCGAYIYLYVSKCGQYLEVKNMCLEHNHDIIERPATRIEKRAERRRQNLMKLMKISYEEAVIMERLKIKAKDRLVGPAEVEDDSLCNEEIIISNFEDQVVEITTSDFNLKQTAFSGSENMVKEVKEKETTNEKAKEAIHAEVPVNDNEEHLISDNDDYRRPLFASTKMQQDDNNDISTLEQSHFTSGEDNDDPSSKQTIFTRKGDDGMACTFSGMRLYKDDIVFEALGTIEELSCSIGHAKEFLPENCADISEQLVEIQCVLQDMVIHVGTPRGNCSEFQKENSQFPESFVIRLENLIQMHEGKLPKDNPIILPSGGPGSTSLHLARAVCRRAERKVVGIVREGDADRTVACYLNRLGDYLFVAARVAAKSFIYGKKECVYAAPNFYVKPTAPVNIVKPTIPVFANTNTSQSYIIYVPPSVQVNPPNGNLLSNS